MIQALIYVYIFASIINLLYWCFIFSKLAFHKPKKEDLAGAKDDVPVSIIICARNEAANLKKNLPHILNQSYRSFEVLVVNDDSTDDTEQVLLDFELKNPYLRIINFYNKKKSYIGKKHALAKGIEAAQNDILLLTDADCRPSSPFWLQKMQGLIREDIEIGLGYGPYTEAPGLLNKFIHYETVYTAIQYFSFALMKIPYMGVGRNLIYKKSLFHKAKGFTSHEHIASGDDDLFISQVAEKNNVGIVLDKGTFMFSEPKTTWRSYYRQKTRHLSTATVYQFKHKLVLGMLSVTHFLHYTAGILIALLFSIKIAGVIYLVRMFTMVFMYDRILKKLGGRFLLPWIPLMDALYVLFYLIFSPSLFIGKNNQWT